MSRFIYDGLSSIFGSGSMGSLKGWMADLLEVLSDILSNGSVDVAFGIFSAIACSLLVLYFYNDLVSQASRDMFTFEKMVISFMKVMLAFTLLLSIKPIVTGLVDIGQDFFNISKDISFTESNATDIRFCFRDKTYKKFPEWSEVSEAFNEEYDAGITNIGTWFPVFFTLVIPSLILTIAKVAGFLITASTAIILLLRCIMSPIAIVNCFEDGTRSAGIMYLKKIASQAISMGCCVLAIATSQALTNGLIVNEFKKIVKTDMVTITFENITEFVSWNNLTILILPQLVLIGVIMGVGRIADDILGVR